MVIIKPTNTHSLPCDALDKSLSVWMLMFRSRQNSCTFTTFYIVRKKLCISKYTKHVLKMRVGYYNSSCTWNDQFSQNMNKNRIIWIKVILYVSVQDFEWHALIAKYFTHIFTMCSLKIKSGAPCTVCCSSTPSHNINNCLTEGNDFSAGFRSSRLCSA